MTDAPERIWATHSETWGAVELGQWADTVRHKGGEPYVHERLYTAQQETIAALVDALEPFVENASCWCILDGVDKNGGCMTKARAALARAKEQA